MKPPDAVSLLEPPLLSIALIKTFLGSTTLLITFFTFSFVHFAITLPSFCLQNEKVKKVMAGKMMAK
jgi:hypothetical protein